jgi:phosphoserine phosphatase
MPDHKEKILSRFLEHHAVRSAHNPPVAVFDCDDTLIRGDIGESMFYFQLEHFLFRTSPALLWPDYPRREALGNIFDSLSLLPPEKAVLDRRFPSLADMMLDWYFSQLAEYRTAKACGDIVRLYAGFSPAEVHDIARATLRKELEAPIGEWTLGTHSLPRGVRFIAGTIALLRTLQSRGFEILVVSGSNQWSVEAVCSHLGLPAKNVIGIGLQESSGTYQPKVIEPVPVLEGKVDSLEQRMRVRPSIVVSDSTYDMPLFQHSDGLKVLIAADQGTAFFRQTDIVPDDSWLIFDHHTLLQSVYAWLILQSQ